MFGFVIYPGHLAGTKEPYLSVTKPKVPVKEPYLSVKEPKIYLDIKLT